MRPQEVSRNGGKKKKKKKVSNCVFGACRRSNTHVKNTNTKHEHTQHAKLCARIVYTKTVSAGQLKNPHPKEEKESLRFLKSDHVA